MFRANGTQVERPYSCKSHNLVDQIRRIQWAVIHVKNEGFLTQGTLHKSSFYLRSQSCLKKRFKINVSKPKAFDGIVRHRIDPLKCTEILEKQSLGEACFVGERIICSSHLVSTPVC